MRKLAFLTLLLLPCAILAQSDNQDIFTVNVVAPTAPQDVQVRYFLSGDPAVQQSGSVAKPEGNRIVVKTSVEGKSAAGIRAIVFSPGCQFFTVSADNLGASTRQADFQCQKLATTQLHGKVDVSRFAGKDLQLEALYMCTWAGQFFGVPALSISPFSLGKTKVDAEGTFALELPDFASDPLWQKLSSNATLTFMLVDKATGQRLARLSAPGELSRRGALKVAAGYPAEIQFAAR